MTTQEKLLHVLRLIRYYAILEESERVIELADKTLDEINELSMVKFKHKDTDAVAYVKMDDPSVSSCEVLHEDSSKSYIDKRFIIHGRDWVEVRDDKYTKI